MGRGRGRGRGRATRRTWVRVRAIHIHGSPPRAHPVPDRGSAGPGRSPGRFFHLLMAFSKRNLRTTRPTAPRWKAHIEICQKARQKRASVWSRHHPCGCRRLGCLGMGQRLVLGAATRAVARDPPAAQRGKGLRPWRTQRLSVYGQTPQSATSGVWPTGE